MMPPKYQAVAPNDEITNPLKKLLVLHLFEMGIPQSDIGKKLKTDLTAINAFLKGIKTKNAQKRTE